MCTHTHTFTELTTKAANEQECPQISETARQLSQQGAPLIGRLLSAANGAPQSDNGTPGFSRHGCVNTVQWRTGEKNNGENGAGGGEAGGEGETLSPLFSWLLLLFNVKMLRSIINGRAWSREWQHTSYLEIKKLHIAVLKAASFRGAVRTVGLTRVEANSIQLMSYI